VSNLWGIEDMAPPTRQSKPWEMIPGLVDTGVNAVSSAMEKARAREAAAAALKAKQEQFAAEQRGLNARHVGAPARGRHGGPDAAALRRAHQRA
jgi:hypothetical protein